MPPEDIAALAALHGMPVEHFDGHSVVHTPDGPMPIVHAPAARPPQRIALPEMRITAPSAERQARIAADDAEMARQQAYTAAHGRTPEQDRQRELAYVQDRAPTLQRDGSLPPEVQRQLDQWTAERARESRVSAMAGSGVLAREQDRRAEVGIPRTVVPMRPELPGATSAGVTTLPDGTTITTDDRGRVVPTDIPEGTPPEWLTGDARTQADLRQGARSALAAGQSMQTRAPVTAGALPQMVGESGSAPAPQGPMPDGSYMGGAAPAPSGAPIARGGGGARPAGPQLSADGLTYANQPAVDTSGVASYMPGGANYSAQDTGPDSLGGQPIGTARRAPDSIDRSMLLEQQRAGLAQKAAQTQLGIEQQAEQQRQQLEQDRQAAVQQAQQRYQNAIQRVSDAHLDPQRWFRDQGAGGTVAAVIAVALGAAGQALTGASTNGALDQINEAIDRDMQAQQSEIDSARAGADLQGNMLNITRQEFSDRQAALDAARAGMLQQAALHVQEMEGSLAGQEAQVNAEAMRAQLEQQAAAARAAAEERQSQIDLRQAQTLRELQNARIAGVRADRLAHPGPDRPHPVTSAQADGYRNIMALNPDLTPEQGAYLAGLPFVPTQTVTLTEQNDIAPLEAELANLEQMIPASGDVPGVGPLDGRVPDLVTSPEGLNIRESVGQVLELLGRLHSGGAISDQENVRFTTLIGSGATQSDSALRRGVQTIRREIAARLRGRAHAESSASRDHAEVGFTPDA